MNARNDWIPYENALGSEKKSRKNGARKAGKVSKRIYIAANGTVFEASARSLNGVRAARGGAARLTQVAEQWKNTSPEKLAGRMAEELHATTFNIDAAAKGLNALKASTEAANGAATAVDITITKGPLRRRRKCRTVARRALAAARKPEAVAGELISQQMASAVKKGAATGAIVGGGISAISNVGAYAKGNKCGKDAIVDTVMDTATRALSGAAVSGAAVAAESMLVRVGACTLARGSAPVAIGLMAVDIGKDIVRLINGDISSTQLAGRSACNVAKGGCTWGGMEGGAALGTFILPGVGTVVGGILGCIVGGLFGGWLFN